MVAAENAQISAKEKGKLKAEESGIPGTITDDVQKLEIKTIASQKVSLENIETTKDGIQIHTDTGQMPIDATIASTNNLDDTKTLESKSLTSDDEIVRSQQINNNVPNLDAKHESKQQILPGGESKLKKAKRQQSITDEVDETLERWV